MALQKISNHRSPLKQRVDSQVEAVTVVGDEFGRVPGVGALAGWSKNMIDELRGQGNIQKACDFYDLPIQHPLTVMDTAAAFPRGLEQGGVAIPHDCLANEHARAQSIWR